MSDKPVAMPLTVTATVRRAGRTLAIVDIDVADSEGRLVAVGRGCYATSPGRGARSSGIIAP
jgi:acyl-coenzyme A thioesterase PaaI-like protein